MKLIYVYVVGPEQPQALLQILLQLPAGRCHGLGAYDNFISGVFKGRSDLFFAVGVGPGCVEIVYAVVEGFLKEIYGVFL